MIHATPMDSTTDSFPSHLTHSDAITTASHRILEIPEVAAAIEKRRLVTDITPLSLYVATWMMEPDQPIDTLQQIVYTLDEAGKMQKGSKKG